MKNEYVKNSLTEYKLGFDLLVERLKRALNVSSDADLCRIIGMSSSNFANRKRANSFPFEILIPLCISRFISTDWLFTGDGDIFTNGERADFEPVAAVDPQLFGIITFEMERAFSKSVADSIQNIEHAAQLGLLAAAIYNKVAHIKNDKQRRLVIMSEAEGFAHAATLLQTQKSILPD